MKRIFVLSLLVLTGACGGSTATRTETTHTETTTTTTEHTETGGGAADAITVTLDGAPFAVASVLVADWDAGNDGRRVIRFYDRVVTCPDATIMPEGTRYVDLRVNWTTGEQTTDLAVGSGTHEAGTGWGADGRVVIDTAGVRGERSHFTVSMPESGNGEHTVSIEASVTAEICYP